MPNYKANIQLQNADERDHVLLTERLKKKSFKRNDFNNDSSILYFTKENSAFHQVANEIATAAKKSGKQFSFTIETIR